MLTGNNGSPPNSAPRAALLWAIFLGCSWTWIIGMFLPVLLVRDYGIWGWIVFAVPNVVGAAAMGWVLRDASASEAFVRRHAAMCYGFSLVTIAYHAFFAMWMIERLRGFGLIALGLFVVAAFVPGRDPIRWAGAAAVLFVSLAMWWMLYRQHGMLRLPRPHPASAGALWLLPAFALGFGLCPYLDLTFHRARQATSPAGGRLAFGVGFGVVFLTMIVFTLLYAQWIAPSVAGQSLGALSTLFLCIHLMVQSAFTVAIHVRELPRRSAFINPEAARFAGIMALLVVVGAAGLGWIASSPERQVLGHDFGEAVYWCFLGFYGLLFPGYLWIHGFARAQATTRSLLVLMVAVAVAFPAYWMVFLERQPLWILPGLSILLASRALVPPDGSPPAG